MIRQTKNNFLERGKNDYFQVIIQSAKYVELVTKSPVLYLPAVVRSSLLLMLTALWQSAPVAKGAPSAPLSALQKAPA